MRFVSVRSVGAFMIVFTIVGAVLAVGPPQRQESSPTGEALLGPDAAIWVDASGNFHRIRNGAQSGSFYFSGWSGDASGYAQGYFSAIDDPDRPGRLAYQVNWDCYSPLRGYEYASGIAPASAVRAFGNDLWIDFDTSDFLEFYNGSGPTNWTGMFLSYDKGPYSDSSTFRGQQIEHEEYPWCTMDQRISGTQFRTTANFAGMCGSFFVPDPLPNARPNGYEYVLRGRGWVRTVCPP